MRITIVDRWWAKLTKETGLEHGNEALYRGGGQ